MMVVVQIVAVLLAMVFVGVVLYVVTRPEKKALVQQVVQSIFGNSKPSKQTFHRAPSSSDQGGKQT